MSTAGMSGSTPRNVATLPSTSPLSETLIKRVQQILDKYQIPGAAVSIVRKVDGEWARGVHTFGIRDRSGAKWEGNSLFPIASSSKALTSATTGLLIERKTPIPGANGQTLQWGTKVKSILPDWEVQDRFTMERANIDDALSMRLGLAANNQAFGAPDETAEKIVHRMRHHKPAAELRQHCIYCNDNLTTVGQVIAKVTGKPYHEFVTEQVLKPLGMTGSTYDREAARQTGRRVEGFMHFERDPVAAKGLLEADKWGRECVGDVGEMEYWNKGDGFWNAAAGGLLTSADEVCFWLREFLDPRLFSKSIIETMRRPRAPFAPLGTHRLISEGYYGLSQMAWVYRSVRLVGHGGSLPGHYTHIFHAPDEADGGFAVAIMANDESFGSAFVMWATYVIVDELLGFPVVSADQGSGGLGARAAGKAKVEVEGGNRENEAVDWEEIFFLKGMRSVPDIAHPPATFRSSPEVDVSAKYTHPAYGEIVFSRLADHPLAHEITALLAEYPGNTLPRQANGEVYVGDVKQDIAGMLILTPFDGPVFTRAWFKAEPITPVNPAQAGNRKYAGHMYNVGKAVVTTDGLGMYGDFWGVAPAPVGPSEPVEEDVEGTAEVWFKRV